MADAAQPTIQRRGPALAYLVPIVMGLLDLPYGISIRALRFFGGSRLPRLADTPRRRRRGLTIVLGGIEGPSFFNSQIVRGILASGYRGAVVRYDWNAGILVIRSVVNLMSTRHIERGARAVREIIEAYRAEHPTAPISIVSQSGGCFVAIRALEQLPAPIRISTVVLHAAAISRDYDLRAAVDRCDDALISIEACGDFVLLGAGTLLFGTSDRRISTGAGFLGFRNPPRKLVALRWHPDWLAHGHLGNHTSSASFAFVRDIVGPRLRCRLGGIAVDSVC